MELPTSPSEAPVASPAAAPADEQRLALLARKDRELQQRESKLKDSISLSELQALAKTNKSEFEKKLGLSLKDLLSEDSAAAAPEDPLESLRSEISALRNKDTQREIDNYKSSIRKHLEQTPDDYELINQLAGPDEVYEMISDHYNKTGIVLDLKEAADKLETYYLEQVKKITKANKLKALLAPEESTPKAAKTSVTPVPSLSPQMSAPAAQPREFNARTIEESKRRAASLIKWD